MALPDLQNPQIAPQYKLLLELWSFSFSSDNTTFQSESVTKTLISKAFLWSTQQALNNKINCNPTRVFSPMFFPSNDSIKWLFILDLSIY